MLIHWYVNAHTMEEILDDLGCIPVNRRDKLTNLELELVSRISSINSLKWPYFVTPSAWPQQHSLPCSH